MSDFDTERPGLPVALEPSRPRPSLQRSQITAMFVSQLLAGRHNLPPQRARCRSSTEVAIGAYADGAKVAIKRMPMGYRTTIVA